MQMVKLKCKTCGKLFPDEGDMKQPWRCIDCRPSKHSMWRGNEKIAKTRWYDNHTIEHPSTVCHEPQGHLSRLRDEDVFRTPRRWTKYEDM